MSLEDVLGNSFASWLRESGLNLENIIPAYVAEGWRGMVAERDVFPGSMFSTRNL